MFRVFLYTSLDIEVDHIVFVVSEILALYKVDLFVHDEYRYDQDDRQRELECNQSLAYPHFADGAVQFPLQHRDGVKSGQIEGGVTPCDHAGEERNAYQGHSKSGIRIGVRAAFR